MGAANPTATKPETTVPTDPVLAALKAQHDLLAAQVAIQKEQQALFTSTLPTSNATPSSGAFTVSGTNPFPSQRLAYIQLGNIGAEIGERVAHAGATAVAFFDAAEISALINYDTVTSVLMNLDLLANRVKAKYDGDIRPMVVTLSTLHDVASAREIASLPATTAMPPILLPGLILAGLKTASDIVGMFRMNTNIAYSNFNLDDAALIADVANALISNGVAAYQPALMPGVIAVDSSRFMTLLSNIQLIVAGVQYDLSSDQARIQQLSDALNAFVAADRANEQNRDEASALTDPVVLVGLKVKQAGLQRERDVARLYVLRLLGANADLDAATSTIRKAECDQFLRAMSVFATSVSSVAIALSTLQSTLLAVSSTGAATLASILRAENLKALLNGGVQILLVKLSVLGGSVVTRAGPLRGGRLLFTGGAIANFTLFDNTGKIVASDVVVSESPPERMKF